MAVVDQRLTTYSDTTPHIRVIADLLSIISPRDTPAVAYFGLNGSPEKFRIVNWPNNTKVEWLEDELAALTDTLGASCTSDTVSITVTDGSLHHVGDVIEADAEMMWVSAISTNTLTVTRNYAGTQASHANSATITRITNARIEGADADYDRAVFDKTAPYNYTQILQDDLTLSGSLNNMTQYGIANEWELQAAKKIPELTILIEKAFFRGPQKAGSASTPRGFGGLETYITDNSASLSGEALTEKDLLDRVQAAWDDGGKPDLIICNAWIKRKINGMFEGYVRTMRDETRGGVLISEIETDFGLLSVLMDRWCPSDKLYIVESQHVGFLPFRPFFWEDLAKTGDARKGQVVGEYVLVVRHDKAHARLESISTTS